MPDRADYLARTLLNRRRTLEAALADDGDVAGGLADRRREDLVVKVLAVEAGVTDSAVVRRVWNAMPEHRPHREETEQARAELAAFLRGVLRFD